MTMVTEYDFETNTLIHHDARHAFRTMVAEVAARAKERLPQAVNGRVESAVKLVLAHDVTPQADGSIEVGSSSDPLKTYTLTGQACTCQDFERGQAPEGGCQHRIAAAIAKRVQGLLPGGVSETDTTPGPQAPAAALQPLPEAPFSLTLKGTLGGQDALLTVRGITAAEFQANLAAVRALLDAPAPASPPAPTQGQGDTPPQCPTHGALKRSTKGKGWYCPTKLDDDTWCPSKGK